MEASAKEGEGAGRGPCGLRNSELGPLAHNFCIFVNISMVCYSMGFYFTGVLSHDLDCFLRGAFVLR